MEMGTIAVYVSFYGMAHPISNTILLSGGSTRANLDPKVRRCFAPYIPTAYPVDLKYMWYDHSHGKFLCLPKDQVLQDEDRVDVYVESEKIKPNEPIRPHALDSGTRYYFCSYLSQKNDGLMKKGASINSSSTLFEAKCNGKSTDSSDLIHFEAKSHFDVISKKNIYVFTLPSQSSKKVFALKGKGEDQDVVIEEIDDPISILPDKEYRWLPFQTFSYTLFQWQDPGGREDLYLMASKDGSMQVIKGAVHPGYPKPSTLFMVTHMK